MFMIGEDPNDFIRHLIKDGFSTFISLHEWQHEWYKDYIHKFSKENKKLIAFTIDDFGICDDRKTVQFIEKLIKMILQSNQDFVEENNRNAVKWKIGDKIQYIQKNQEVFTPLTKKHKESSLHLKQKMVK